MKKMLNSVIASKVCLILLKGSKMVQINEYIYNSGLINMNSYFTVRGVVPDFGIWGQIMPN